MLEGGPANPAPTGSASPSTEGHHPHFVDANDPLLPSSLKKEDAIVKEEGDPIGPSPTSPAAEGGVVKANKDMILRKNVEYIR